MKATVFHTSIVLVLFLWIGVSTSSAQLLGNLLGDGTNSEIRQGNYLAALVNAHDELQERPDAKMKQKKFGKAYQEGLDSVLADIRALEAATDVFVGEANLQQAASLVDHYEKMEKVRLGLESMGLSTIKMSRKEELSLAWPPFADELQASYAKQTRLTEQVAEMHYLAGNRLMESGQSKDEFKAAAREYARAEALVAGYKDAAEKYQEARSQAIKRIIILPFANRSGRPDLGDIGSMLSNSLIISLQNDPQAMEFLDIISEMEIRNAVAEAGYTYGGDISNATAQQLAATMGADEVWMGQVSQIAEGTPQISGGEARTATARVKVGTRQETRPNGKTRTVDVYEERSAVLKGYNISVALSMSGSYSVVDQSPSVMPRIEQFTMNNNWNDAYTIYVSGNQEVYNRNADPKAELPPLGLRVNAMVEAEAAALYRIIKLDATEAEIPMVMSVR